MNEGGDVSERMWKVEIVGVMIGEMGSGGRGGEGVRREEGEHQL